MITLYHLTNSRSQRIVWLLAELGVDYQLVFCERKADGTASDDLKSVHLLGKVPVIKVQGLKVQDLKGEGVNEQGLKEPSIKEEEEAVIAETGAIVDYLAINYAGHPLFSQSHNPDYLYWKNFAEASFMPNLALKQILHRMVTRSPWVARPVTGTIKKAIDRQYLNLTIAEQMMMVDAALAQRDYLAGEALTAADILMAFLLQALAVSMPNFTQYRHVVEYLTTLQAGEAYQNAQTKGKFNDDEFTRYWANTW